MSKRRTATGLVLGLILASAVAHAAEAPSPPTGLLPDTIKPTAYRLQLTVDPAAANFQGHTEIDAVLAQPTKTIFLHGNGLRVSKAQITAGNKTVPVSYAEVHESGVAKLDAPSTLPAGKLTLTFDYTSAFQSNGEGLYHAKVGEDWYAWTQMEPIDARRMFPGFDQPGFKTPFSVTITAPKSAKAFANAPEISTTPSGEMIVHRFASTQPLPTYLVAIGVGPFDVLETVLPPNAVRTKPLPLRVIATKGQTPRMQFALREGPKLLDILEKYLRIAYPYEKLDLLASPLMGGAMENAGLIISNDALQLLSEDAPMSQLRSFGEVMAHEMAHQWFGDLVTPTWWTDIWLNESFAEWMGKKVGDQWRPELGIAASELTDTFGAMNTDALGHGRPIRQPITENKQIASAFDSITYQKGAQVLSMFESYLGPEKFAEGVHRHLERYRHGNATADDFFRSLGEAAGNPKIVPAMRTFTDQTGVPVVIVSRNEQALTLRQERYRRLGAPPAAPQTWMIPVCLSAGSDNRSCTLLEGASASVNAAPPAGQALVPNARGAGYYRFRFDSAAEWDRLIAAADKLPGREALSLADSIWADFTAGTGSFERVIAAARSLSGNSERLAVVELGRRLSGLAGSALDEKQLPQYRAIMRSIYGPRLAALGLNVEAGAYKQESDARQALRQALLPFVAVEARDADVRTKLTKAAEDYLNGNTQALDPAFRSIALSVAIQDRGAPFMTKLRDAMAKSSDPLFRRHGVEALGSVDTAELADTAYQLASSPGLQSMERAMTIIHMTQQPASRKVVARRAEENFDKFVEIFPGFFRRNLSQMFNGYCSAGDAQKVDAFMTPKLPMLGGGELELAQVKERIELCVALKNAKGTEIAQVLKSP
jgi:aminopeptidase N